MTHQSALKFNYTKPRKHREADLQSAIVQIIRIMGQHGLVWGASMSGVHLGIRAAMRMKGQGMQAGEPDLWFLIGGHYYGMEVKNGKAGRQSPEQADFESRVIASGGTYAIVRDIEQAQSLLESWGAIRPRTKTKMTYARAA